MKKILYILITVPLIFISCSKDWVDLKPTTQVLSNEAIKNILDAEYAINGIYSTFQSSEYYGARMQYYADVTGDDMQATGTNKRASAYYMMYTTPIMYILLLWALPYRIMRNANNILSQIDGLSVTPTEAAQKDDFKGQARC